jgi:hypothetical protein
MKRDSYYYQHNINTLVLNAERRVEALKLQREIFAINAQLKILDTCLALYPPQDATVEEPLAVHTAPPPDQEKFP